MLENILLNYPCTSTLNTGEITPELVSYFCELVQTQRPERAKPTRRNGRLIHADLGDR